MRKVGCAVERDLGAEADVLGQQRGLLPEKFAALGRQRRIVDLHEDLSGLHHVALPHVDPADDPAFEALDDLHLLGRDDTARGARHFLDLEERGPCEERADACEDEEDHPPAAAPRAHPPAAAEVVQEVLVACLTEHRPQPSSCRACAARRVAITSSFGPSSTLRP